MSASTASPKPDEKTDLEVIAPTVVELDVAGTKARVNRVRTRELMLLARVLTTGVGQNIKVLDLESDEWQQQAMGLLLMAIPEAHDEVLDLLQALVRPVEKITDDELRNAFVDELRNPEIDLTMDILVGMIEQEKDTFPLLLGKGKQVLGHVKSLLNLGKVTKKTTG